MYLCLCSDLCISSTIDLIFDGEKYNRNARKKQMNSPATKKLNLKNEIGIINNEEYLKKKKTTITKTIQSYYELNVLVVQHSPSELYQATQHN